MDKVQDDALQALLGAELTIEEEVFIKRLGVNFKVKAIDGKMLSKIQEQCTHYVGKGSKRTKQFDEEGFGALIVAKACVSPDFGNKALLEKYEASDAGDCVQKALLAGEIGKLNEAILGLSGFGDEEEIEEVKN
jgi:hypothetical protein